VDRYWKWIYRERVSGIYRLKNGRFEEYSQGKWQYSDRFERAVQDPEFLDINEEEANKLIRKFALSFTLGTNPSAWPSHCLIPYPAEFDTQIDKLGQALKLANTDPDQSRDIVKSIDSEEMKRWFIDVALKSGAWRSKYSGVSGVDVKSSRRRKAINQKRLEALFERDKWRCRYCGIRIAGNRKHFKKFAKTVRIPELVSGRTDENRHGVYLMLMASYDHVKPHSEGGSNDDNNLVTACWSCQFGKYKYSLEILRLQNPLDKEPLALGDWRGLKLS
jgi:5-methylcytosine-specific restriction endonuclease McrA